MIPQPVRRRTRFPSLSGASSRGVERSNDSPVKSSASSGRVNVSMTSCMNGRPEVGSWPSM